VAILATGRPTRIEVVRQSLDGDHTVRLQEQESQHRPLPRAAQLDRPRVADCLKRPEDPEFEHGGDGNASIAP
jgi:hypothetical protein